LLSGSDRYLSNRPRGCIEGEHVTQRTEHEPRSGAQRKQLAVQTGFCSERGERPRNEDYTGTYQAPGARSLVIAAVADGVGGAKGGRVAAELAVRGFIEGCTGQAVHASAREMAIHSLEAMNRWIHAVGRVDANLHGMACTFTGLLCSGRQAHIVHVGDSRLYRMRGERLDLLTTDHMAGPGQRHILTRAVGAEMDVRVDYVALQNEPYDRYLFCTDGVHAGLSDGTLREMLGRRAAPDETAREIVDRALAARVGDNATALILDVVELPPADYADLAATMANGAILPVPAVGALVDGFRLDAMLSDGRYMRVFRASDQADGRTFVLKFPKPLAGAERPTRDAFLRETWIASRVHSPFVGEILQLGADRQTQLYLTLPFYAGETLESRLQRRPALTLAAGLDIAQKLAKGIAALHRAGVIHRDIKPDNVILQPPTPRQPSGVKLIDFGVARLRQSPEAAGTAQPGTPSYMAPELFDGSVADERSDQFALGVTVYRLFSGRFPYGEIEPFTHPKFRVPPPILAHRPDLPAWLDKAIGRAIAVTPNDRYEDVLEFMFELEHGADRASPIHVEHKPLYHRNPLLFWKAIAALLALLLVASLLLPRAGPGPFAHQGPAKAQRGP
jgi:serine/threonine protein phosphatase PrpC